LELNKRNGFWWLPNNPEAKMYGHLEYRYGYHVNLSLDGTLDNNVDAQYHEIVLGRVGNCKITLLNCVRIRFAQTMSGNGNYSKSTYRAAILIKGDHLLKVDDLKFSHIEVNYSHLKDWIGHHLIEFPVHQVKDNQTILTLKKPKIIEVHLENLTVEIKGTYSNSYGFFKTVAEQDVIVSFSSLNTSFMKVVNVIQDFRNFLELLIDEEIGINKITTGTFDQQLEIIFPKIMKKKNPKDHFHSYPVPVEANLIIPKIDSYLNNWFIFIEKYEPVYELYFGELYKRTYVTNRILNYCQALEAYYSRNKRFDEKFFDGNCEDLFDKFMAIIETSDLKPFDETIRTKLGFLTRKTLRMVVEELVKDNEEAVSAFISDKESFANLVVKIRNYYTHYSSSKKPKFKELIKLAEDLRFLLVAIMVKEIGFDQYLTNRTTGLYCRDRIMAIYGLRGIFQD
jgi:hypothetical protein